MRLNKETDPRKMDNYKKLSSSLRNSGYLQPREILFSSMQKYVEQKVDTLWAKDMFAALNELLNFKMSSPDLIEFGNIRENRNKIAHGKTTFKPTLADVISSNKFYKKVAKQLDNHIALHFAPIKNFHK